MHPEQPRDESVVLVAQEREKLPLTEQSLTDFMTALIQGRKAAEALVVSDMRMDIVWKPEKETNAIKVD